MKAIWKSYGRTMLYVLLAGTLTTLAVLAAGGAQREETAAEIGYDRMHAAMERYYQGEPPVITYTGGTLRIGETRALEDYFQALDEEGGELSVCIRGIWDGQGQAASYPFSRPGRYRIEAGAQDANGRSTDAAFWVPVNQGEL